MSWSRVAKSALAMVAHGLLFCFTLFLALKVDTRTTYSWWIIFVPLWLFHAVVARGRFSLPAPSLPHDRHRAPCHAIVATLLFIAFELLLCVYLESVDVYNYPAVNLNIVFLPLLAFEAIILVDNFRMCRALMPGDEESMSDEAIWETLPPACLHVTGEDQGRIQLITQKNSGYSKEFLVSTPSENFYWIVFRSGHIVWPARHWGSHHESSSRCFPGSAVHAFGDCLVGGPLTRVAKKNKLVYFRLDQLGINTFCGYPPEVVKKMSKKDLSEEVWRLQAALGEQAEITKYSQQEYERLQNEKVLCRICFEGEICMVLPPCRHRIVCKPCSDKCKRCPICRVPVEECMPVYDV